MQWLVGKIVRLDVVRRPDKSYAENIACQQNLKHKKRKSSQGEQQVFSVIVRSFPVEVNHIRPVAEAGSQNAEELVMDPVEGLHFPAAIESLHHQKLVGISDSGNREAGNANFLQTLRRFDANMSLFIPQEPAFLFRSDFLKLSL